jgi:predicted transcriptional regulator
MRRPRRKLFERTIHFRSTEELDAAIQMLADEMRFHPSQLLRAAVTDFVQSRMSDNRSEGARHAQ